MAHPSGLRSWDGLWVIDYRQTIDYKQTLDRLTNLTIHTGFIRTE